MISSKTAAHFRAGAMLERAAGNFDLAFQFEEYALGGQRMNGRQMGCHVGALNSPTVSTQQAIAALEEANLGEWREAGS